MTTKETTVLPYANQVQAGIALLNDLLPEWRTFVNPSTLDVSRYNSCIIGQILTTPTWQVGEIEAYEVFMQLLQALTGEFFSTRYGFSIEQAAYDGERTPAYAKLNATWLALAFGQPQEGE